MTHHPNSVLESQRIIPAAMGTILSIWAHPDDETYLAAGIMASARDQGQRVVCVSATAGELGTDDPDTWPPSRLGQVRRWEAAAAMAVLGVDEHHVLGLPDGRLEDHDAEGLAWARGVLDEVRPETILTFGPDGMTYHPDHIAVHRWVTAAWRERGCRERLLYATSPTEHLDRFRELYEEWNMYMSDERPRGVPISELDVYVRLQGFDLDRKITALRALSTQTAGVMSLVGADVYAEQVCEEAYVAAERIVGSSPASVEPHASASLGVEIAELLATHLDR
jgi:LmbE family N-acetylglucosaminyl deacetylase